MFELDNIINEAILRDFFIFQSWQHQKRSNSARLPQFLNLITSKTKQSCESSFFEVDNCKNETILRDVPQKWKVECRTDGLVPMRFAIFPVHLSEVLRLPRKSDARSYEVLHLSRRIISANLKISGSKMQPLSGNQRPDLLTALMNMSLVLRLPRKMHLSRSSSNVPRLPSFLETLQNPRFAHFLTRSTIPCACHAKWHLNVQKWSEHLHHLNLGFRGDLTICNLIFRAVFGGVTFKLKVKISKVPKIHVWKGEKCKLRPP